MCGISGILYHEMAGELIHKMVSSQHHRGPDANAVYIDEAANSALGHNRLSIIDLSELGNQPMKSINNRYVIVFNGEIYNYPELKEELKDSYSFITQTDTEVLLAAWIQWGSACLEKLNGMFSFAIWDTIKQELFAARDRFGVKPFYYNISNGTFRFGSEIKTLWAGGVTKTINDGILANYFCYGSYGLPHQTFWDGIEQLPGGHLLTFSRSSGVTVKRWYYFEERIQRLISNAKPDITEDYKELLFDSIKLRFRSDVKVGFTISGGVDSSMLLALVNQSHPNSAIEAYSFYTGDERYDELPWIQEMISKTRNPLITCKLTATEVPALMEEVANAQDEPFGGIPTLAYANLFKVAQQHNTKVLLDGQGMDEAWAGYDYYHNHNGQVIQGLGQSPFSPEVLSDDLRSLASKEEYPQPFQCNMMNLQYRDLFYTKIPRALRFNDRVSMMSSTELREPFLDYRLVELAFSRPREEKWNNGHTKWLLRNLASQYLGNQLSYAPKRALQTPQREWLSQDLRPFVTDLLQKSDHTGYFKKGMLARQYAFFCANPVQSVNIWQYMNVAAMI